MSTNKMLSLVVISGVLAFSGLPASAESLSTLERAQISDSTSLNVDAGASEGADEFSGQHGARSVRQLGRTGR